MPGTRVEDCCHKRDDLQLLGKHDLVLLAFYILTETRACPQQIAYDILIETTGDGLIANMGMKGELSAKGGATRPQFWKRGQQL